MTEAVVIPGTSDHDALLATLSVKSERPTSRAKEVYNFERADWQRMGAELEFRLECVMQQQDTSAAWEMWKNTVMDCVEEFVPKKKTGGRRKRQHPWITKGLKKLISIRDELFERWQQDKSVHSRDIYKAARKSTQSAISAARNNWLWKLGLGREQSKDLWRYIKSKAKTSIGPLHSKSTEKQQQTPR